MAISVTVRRARLSDGSALLALLTAVTSEVVAQWGSCFTVSSAQYQSMLNDPNIQLAVAIDATSTLRGFVLFFHNNPNLPVPDAWEVTIAATDKTLVLSDRLAVLRQLIKAAVGTVPDTTGVWGDAIPGTNADTFLSQQPFNVIPNTPSKGMIANRYWTTAGVLATI